MFFLNCALMTLVMSANAATSPDPIDELKQGMPKPVVELIDRIVDCNHWLGEEPYDGPRKIEINQAIKELRCSALTHDEQVVLKQYGKKVNVRKNIEAAKEFYQ